MGGDGRLVWWTSGELPCSAAFLGFDDSAGGIKLLDLVVSGLDAIHLLPLLTPSSMNLL